MKGQASLRAAIIALALATAACSDSTAPELSYVDISGVYSGTVAAMTVVEGDNIYLNSVFRLILNQNGSQLSGTFGSEGVLSDDYGTVVAIEGVDAITGSVGPGSTPTITITSQNLACPNAQYTETLHYANGLITGTVSTTILDQNCMPLLTFSNIAVALQTS